MVEKIRIVAVALCRSGDRVLVERGYDSALGHRFYRAIGGGVELFNLANDPYEKQNLSEQRPEKVKELLTRYNKIAAQAITPRFEPQPAGLKPPKVWGER